MTKALFGRRIGNRYDLACTQQRTFRDLRAGSQPAMVRMRKDVLRVGTWQTDGGPWNVTHAKMRELVANFNMMKSRGVAINLCNTHGDPTTGIVHPRDLICPIDRLVVEGDAVFAEMSVTPQQAATLRNPANKVSVRAVDGFVDGEGRKYTTALLHVAVVDLPVMGKQLPFTDMGRGSRVRNLAAAAVAAVEPDDTENPAGDIALADSATDGSIWQERRPLMMPATTLFVRFEGTWWTVKNEKDAWKSKRETSENVFEAVRDDLVQIVDQDKVATLIGLPAPDPVPDDVGELQEVSSGGTLDSLGRDFDAPTDMSRGGFPKRKRSAAEVRDLARMIGGR